MKLIIQQELPAFVIEANIIILVSDAAAVTAVYIHLVNRMK
jgi:hypothetical protein